MFLRLESKTPSDSGIPVVSKYLLLLLKAWRCIDLGYNADIYVYIYFFLSPGIEFFVP